MFIKHFSTVVYPRWEVPIQCQPSWLDKKAYGRFSNVSILRDKRSLLEQGQISMMELSKDLVLRFRFRVICT